MIQRLETDAIRDEKDNRPLLHQMRRQRLTEGEKSAANISNKEESSSDKKSEIPCRYKICKKLACKFGILPCVQNFKSESGRNYGDECLFGHAEADETPSKKSKKSGAKGLVALLRESTQLGRVSQDSHPRKSILRKE